MLRLTPDLPAFSTSQQLMSLTGPCYARRTVLGTTCKTLLILPTEWLRKHLPAVIQRLHRRRYEGFAMVWSSIFVLSLTMLSVRSSARCVRSDSGHCRICADICAHIQVQITNNFMLCCLVYYYLVSATTSKVVFGHLCFLWCLLAFCSLATLWKKVVAVVTKFS